jgi:signal transduction histidine kinase
MTNLVGNAWKYSSKRRGAVIEVGRTESDGAPIFFVRDNGVGFDISNAKQLFKPFQRFHSAKEFAGTGVGLATCQRIVRRHGGSIRVTSTPGEGTTVFFSLGPPPRNLAAARIRQAKLLETLEVPSPAAPAVQASLAK